MQVLGWLRQVGRKVGLVRFVSTSESAPPEKIPTRTVTLRELETEVREVDVRALAQVPADLSVPFARLFDAAGVQTPAHGWTIERLGKVLQDSSYKGKSRGDVQRAILQLLSADGAHVQDVVKDAVARDKTLDAFELHVSGKIEKLAAAQQERLTIISERIKDLQAEAAGIQEDAKLSEARWREWRDRKNACEREMAGSLAYLIDESAVSVGDARTQVK
jgi:hypothetical protein